ncbi:MAG: ABC transporter substrate-binding protein [Alphaproteobacteria bacterium]|nr:ABC transporter substrate-binding protein [Alphaproteobacteria bacterium]
MSIRRILGGGLVALVVLSSGHAWAQETTTSHGQSLFGALKYPESFTHFEYANPDAPKGGEVRLAALGTYDSLNPFILKGMAAAGIGGLFETLMMSSEDEPFAQYGLLAESVEMPKDKHWVAFTLRKEARFHDGTPVTAADVVFSFEILKEKGQPFYQAYYKDVEKIEALDERKVRFVFKNNTNRELPMIAGQMPVLSKAYYQKHAFDKTSLEPPVGSGPYKVEKLEPGRKIVYQRDPNYWGKDLPVNKGRNNFDRVIYDYYRDETVAVEALKAGNYDFRAENIARIWSTSYDTPAVKEGRLKKEEIRHEIPTGMQAFIYNIRRPKFSDPKVRQALAYAFDFEWSNKQLFNNSYVRTKSYFSNSMYAAKGVPGPEELKLLEPLRDKLPPEVFTEEYAPPKSDGSGSNREGLLKAKALLEEAGWHIKEGKLENNKGETLQIEFLLNSSAFERVIGPVIQNLKRLGVAATMRVVDASQYQKRIDDFDFDMAVHVFGQSNSPGNEQINYWHSSKADVSGSANLIGIKNPAVDELVDKIVHANSQETLVAACKGLDRVLLWNHYVIPNWHLRSFRIIYWDKFSRPAVSPKYALGFPDTWWWDEEKAKKARPK